MIVKIKRGRKKANKKKIMAIICSTIDMENFYPIKKKFKSRHALPHKHLQ